MKLLIPFFLICLFIPATAQEKHMDLIKAIEEIRLKYNPDKRIAAFTFDIKDEGNKTIISGGTDNPSLKKDIEDTFSGSAYQVKFELLPSKELSSKIYGVVNLSVANLRTKTDNAAEMATQVLLGHPVKVFKKKSGYYFIQTPEKYTAWIDDDGIVLMDEKEMTAWNISNKIIFTSDFGFSYSADDTKSVPVSDLVKGDILKKISVEGKFCKVEYPDKRIAFVLTSEMQDFDKWAASLKPDGEKIVKTAMGMMGIPYLWGGTSVKGMDCSGFTKTVYFMNGLILQRDASQQYYSGDDIDISKGFDKLQPGDLLFFGTKSSGTMKERASHVGIYIGNNEFIHSSGRVRINSLDKSKDNFSAYRFNSLLKAKRLIGAKNLLGIYEVKNLFNISGNNP